MYHLLTRFGATEILRGFEHLHLNTTVSPGWLCPELQKLRTREPKLVQNTQLAAAAGFKLGFGVSGPSNAGRDLTYHGGNCHQQTRVSHSFRLSAPSLEWGTHSSSALPSRLQVHKPPGERVLIGAHHPALACLSPNEIIFPLLHMDS